MSGQRFIFCLLAATLIFTSCNSKSITQDPETDPNDTTVNTANPVETKDPNTSYKPAFKGQTRIGGMTTNTAYTKQIVTSSLTDPWGLTALPAGKLLITEKAGKMRTVTLAGAISNPISGIPEVNDAGQGGLLGLCLDPAFSSNRMVYWVFSESTSNGSITAVAKGKLSNDETAMEGVTVIYRSNTPHGGSNHYGGRVLFDKTGNLMVSIGERSDASIRVKAQAANSSLGKVIRINTAGQPAVGNPTFSASGALPELYSMGHRNPQGLAIHPVSGDIWQSEHGPRGGDEINRLKGGANFGWPTITYGIEYGGQKIGAGIQQQTGMEQPIYYWDPVVSPSGMTFYTGSRIPEWENNLFIGALSGKHIVRLQIQNDKVTGEERLLTAEDQRFRDITQGQDGALYAVTDGGRLYRIDKQ